MLAPFLNRLDNTLQEANEVIVVHKFSVRTVPNPFTNMNRRSNQSVSKLALRELP